MPNKNPTPTTQSPVSDAESLALLIELLAIPGPSGQEGAVMEYIAAKISEEKGAPPLQFDQAHELSDLGGATGNATLQFEGDAHSSRRLFIAHTDTVPICVDCQPKVEGKEITSTDPATGLGGDDRAGVAVLLTTVLGLLRSGITHGPLTFLWTVQEEVGIHGARHVSLDALGEPELAFNFDGKSPERLTIGATGGYRMEITLRGHASHAGNAPEKGVSAIAIASLAIADLVENGWHGLIEKNGKQGTSNVGVIEGGAATNVVTDLVRVRSEARSHDPVFRQQIAQKIERSFVEAAKQVQSTEGQQGEVEFTGKLDYESFLLPSDDPSVMVAGEAIRACGLEPELAIANGGLDANWLTARGVPTVSLGCGQRNIHTAAERLDIADFHLARRIAWRLATG